MVEMANNWQPGAPLAPIDTIFQAWLTGIGYGQLAQPLANAGITDKSQLISENNSTLFKLTGIPVQKLRAIILRAKSAAPQRNLPVSAIPLAEQPLPVNPSQGRGFNRSNFRPFPRNPAGNAASAMPAPRNLPGSAASAIRPTAHINPFPGHANGPHQSFASQHIMSFQILPHDPNGPITDWPHFRDVTRAEAERLLAKQPNTFMIRKSSAFPTNNDIFVITVNSTVNNYTQITNHLIKKFPQNGFKYIIEGQTPEPDLLNPTKSVWSNHSFNSIILMVEAKFPNVTGPAKLPNVTGPAKLPNVTVTADPPNNITAWPYFRNVSLQEANELLYKVVNPTNTSTYRIDNPIFMIRKYELFPENKDIFVVVVIDKFGIIHHTIIKKVEGGGYRFIGTDGETPLNDPDVTNQSRSPWSRKLFKTITEMVQQRFGEDAKPAKLPVQGGRRKRQTRRHKKRTTRKQTKKRSKRN